MGFDMEQNDEIVKVSKFTTIYIKKSLKLELDALKIHRDTYQDAIQRLIDRRNFDIVNNQIITKEMMEK